MGHRTRLLAVVATFALCGQAAADQRIITWPVYARAAQNGYWIVSGTLPFPGRGIYLYCTDISVGVGYAGRRDLVVVEMGQGRWVWQNCANSPRTVAFYAPVTPAGPTTPRRPVAPPPPVDRSRPGFDDLPVGRR
jgi:hypothetical protein